MQTSGLNLLGVVNSWSIIIVRICMLMYVHVCMYICIIITERFSEVNCFRRIGESD